MNDEADTFEGLEIDGAAMAADIESHNAAGPAPAPTPPTPGTLVNPPVEALPEDDAGPAETPPAPAAPAPAPAAPAPAANDLLLAELAASRELNEKMLAALERIAQPAAAPAPVPADPFAGLDPDDPDDRLEIANRKIALLTADVQSVAQSVADQREAAAQAHASAVAQSRIVAEVEQASTRMGVTDRPTKAAMFDLAAAAWGAHEFAAGRADVVQAALRNVEAVHVHARGPAPAPRPADRREPVAPVRGAAAGTLPPPPSASDKYWETADVYDVDAMAERFAADMKSLH